MKKKTIINIFVIFILLCLLYGFIFGDKNIKITKGGNYNFKGNYNCITVNTKENVNINLENVNINCDKGPSINILSDNRVTINIKGNNTITSNTNEDLDGAIYSKKDLVIDGTGNLKIKSNYSGIVSKDTIIIKNGNITIKSKDKGIKAKSLFQMDNGKITINSQDDGIHSDMNVIIKKGTINIESDDDGIHGDGLVEINNGDIFISSEEGIEGTYVKINNGNITINAKDDGINAANKTDIYEVLLEINNGDININVVCEDDCDALDSNGDLIVNGGNINITSVFAFDFDGEGILNNGTITFNGKSIDKITNTMKEEQSKLVKGK